MKQATDRTMKSSWLVQRLNKPTSGSFLGRDNPFAFGGGLRNGGMSDEAMGLLRDIFAFDYMGVAEFEFGAVPDALRKIASNTDRYEAWGFTIPLAEVAANWRDKTKAVPAGDATVYVIACSAWRDEVEGRIREWASVEYGSHLKEQTKLAAALRPVEEWDYETCGWLELDNGFFFFTDEAMWAATARLFGLGEATPEMKGDV